MHSSPDERKTRKERRLGSFFSLSKVSVNYRVRCAPYLYRNSIWLYWHETRHYKIKRIGANMTQPCHICEWNNWYMQLILYICMCVHIYICMYSNRLTYVIYMLISMSIYLYINIYIYIYSCIYLYMQYFLFWIFYYLSSLRDAVTENPRVDHQTSATRKVRASVPWPTIVLPY